LLDNGAVAFIGQKHRQIALLDTKKQGDSAMIELVSNEMIQKQSDISAKLADINQHYAKRFNVELLEVLEVVSKINSTTLPIERVNLYQDWLRAFSQRSVDDAKYAIEATWAQYMQAAKAAWNFPSHGRLNS